MSEFFHHLTHLPPLPDTYLKIAQARTYAHPSENGGYTRLTISPTNIFFKLSRSKFFKDLRERFPSTLNPAFVKTNPMELYDWHVDVMDVRAGINILLTDATDSYTLFKTPTDLVNQFNLTRCDYTPFVPTVFNSASPHCVMNLSNEVRYLLRISTVSVPYLELKQYLVDYQCSSYD